tara:strand:+ start:219 stop:587 length:369 start_codon:yes stop_codon:yes gene_type:complete
MANTTYDASSLLSKRLRPKAGAYLQSLRKSAAMTQLDVAKALKVKYYTFVSQLEGGHGRLPPHHYVPLAKALGIDPAIFTKEMIRYYDPFAYAGLFGGHPDVTNAELEAAAKHLRNKKGSSK